MLNSRNSTVLFVLIIGILSLVGCERYPLGPGGSRDYYYGSPVVLENARTGSLMSSGTYVCASKYFQFRAAITEDKQPGENIVKVLYQVDNGNEYGVPFRDEVHKDFIDLLNPGAGSILLNVRVVTRYYYNNLEFEEYQYAVKYVIDWRPY